MGVFESYGISACNQLPSQVQFDDLAMYEGPYENYTVVAPDLTTDDSCASPSQCNTLSGSCSCNATFTYVGDFSSYVNLNQ